MIVVALFVCYYFVGDWLLCQSPVFSRGCDACQGSVPGSLVDDLRVGQTPDAGRRIAVCDGWMLSRKQQASNSLFKRALSPRNEGQKCHFFAFLSGLPTQGHSCAGSSRRGPLWGALTGQAAMAHFDRPERTHGPQLLLGAVQFTSFFPAERGFTLLLCCSEAGNCRI